MLTNEKIKEAINCKQIQITISFYYEDEKLIFSENEENLLESRLVDNLYSDRLKLTMGNSVKVLNNKRIKSKYRFKSSKDWYDLRKSHNKYVIKPGESIIILTNERIKLNGKYACIIIPRISLSDVGVVVTTAYVDPHYQGLMRLQLSNLSDKTYELSSLEAIAQCFFFELTDFVPEKYKEQFAEKSVFYGQTWKAIMNSDRNPFPIKKQSIKVDKISILKEKINLFGGFLKKNISVVMLITNCVALLLGYRVFKEEYTKYADVMNQIEHFLEPKFSEIIINSGQIYGEKTISVDCSKSDIITVLCNNDEVRYKILSGDVENETIIVFSYSLPSVLNDRYEMNFEYIIVRRIE